MILSFKVSKADSLLIEQIVDRIMIREPDPERQNWRMDITAVHANGCPLRLGELLAADDFNFAHDVYGIHRHIDRRTGKLKDCFLPRFAHANSCVEATNA